MEPVLPHPLPPPLIYELLQRLPWKKIHESKKALIKYEQISKKNVWCFGSAVQGSDFKEEIIYAVFLTQ